LAHILIGKFEDQDHRSKFTVTGRKTVWDGMATAKTNSTKREKVNLNSKMLTTSSNRVIFPSAKMLLWWSGLEKELSSF